MSENENYEHQIQLYHDSQSKPLSKLSHNPIDVDIDVEVEVNAKSIHICHFCSIKSI